MNPPQVRVRAGERTLEGVTVVVQNSDPYTFFRQRPIRVVEPAGLDTGSLAVGVLKHATPLELLTLVPRLLTGRAKTVMRHRQVEPLPDLSEMRIEALDERPFPVHVDGDFIGNFAEVEFGVKAGGLLTVA